MHAGKLPLLFAIDSEYTSDVDDAIGIRAQVEGGWLVTIAIADAAWHVPIDSDDDAFARRQGASVYRGDCVTAHMLPAAMSGGYGALKAGSKRDAMLVSLAIGTDLQVSIQDLSFERLAIDRHLPYDELVPRSKQTGHGAAALRELIALAQALLGRRRSSGALAMYDAAGLVYLDEEGQLKHPATADDAVAHIVVQEFMVLANAALAAWAIARDVPLLYRNHQARSAAPPSADLLASVDGWLNGSARNEEAAQDQLNLLLGPAEYSASALGHYALNLPAYAHCTSPLRRFADLVNQRQLAAAVAGEAMPYAPAELAEIAHDLNALLRQRKQERSAGFKDIVVRRALTALKALGPQRLHRLADHELSQVLKLAAGSGHYSKALIKAVCARIDDASITDKLLDRLLNAPVDTLPAPIRDAWAALLIAAPERAKHLVLYGQQTGLFKRFNLDELPGPAGNFRVRASLARSADGMTLVAKCMARRKKDAEAGATLRVILQHLGHPAGTAVDEVPAHGHAPTAMDNYKGELMKYAQKKHVPAPTFDVQSSGPSHRTLFSCAARIIVDGSEFVANFHGARKRMTAEHAAARLLLQKLPGSPAAGGNQAPDNPVGLLQQKLQQAGDPPPDYVFTESATGFACTVRVSWGSFAGAARTKQGAKAHAARSALSLR